MSQYEVMNTEMWYKGPSLFCMNIRSSNLLLYDQLELLHNLNVCYSPRWCPFFPLCRHIHERIEHIVFTLQLRDQESIFANLCSVTSTTWTTTKRNWTHSHFCMVHLILKQIKWLYLIHYLAFKVNTLI